MTVFVTLSLALAVVALCVALLAARQLWRTVKGLRGALETAQGRLVPLADELQAESAVTATEIERLHLATTQLSESRRGRQRTS